MCKTIGVNSFFKCHEYKKNFDQRVHKRPQQEAFLRVDDGQGRELVLAAGVREDPDSERRHRANGRDEAATRRRLATTRCLSIFAAILVDVHQTTALCAIRAASFA